jgi:Fe-S cluster biogenesis protein NfuA
MDHFSSGQETVISDSERSSIPSDTAIHADDSEVVQMIKELIDLRIRPVIQEDGGDLEYKGFDEKTGIVKLMLRGACRTCSA